ncbi:hypothetical protein ACHAWF_014271 [Thalassiosira exigua]
MSTRLTPCQRCSARQVSMNTIMSVGARRSFWQILSQADFHAIVVLHFPCYSICASRPLFVPVIIILPHGIPLDARPIILFDGECNLCNKFVQTLLKYDNSGNLRFAALQSRVGDLLLRRMSDELRAQVLEILPDRSGVGDDAGEDTERYKSIVVCGPEKTYIRSSAVFQILQSLGGPSKRLRALQYLALIAYVLPTRARDGMYEFVSKRRKRWFGASDECLLWDDRFEDRFVDDGVLTGTFRDPFADPRAMAVPTSTNLFEGESPPVRGDRVRIVWPVNSGKDPSVSYDDEFPDGICLIGGTGTISTVDLPMRVVCRVDRGSIGLGPDADGGDTTIAWVKPEEVAALP